MPDFNRMFDDLPEESQQNIFGYNQGGLEWGSTDNTWGSTDNTWGIQGGYSDWLSSSDYKNSNVDGFSFGNDWLSGSTPWTSTPYGDVYSQHQSKPSLTDKILEFIKSVCTDYIKVFKKIIQSSYTKSIVDFIYMADTATAISAGLYIIFFLLYVLGKRVFIVDLHQGLYFTAIIFAISYIFLYINYNKYSDELQTETDSIEEENQQEIIEDFQYNQTMEDNSGWLENDINSEENEDLNFGNEGNYNWSSDEQEEFIQDEFNRQAYTRDLNSKIYMYEGKADILSRSNLYSIFKDYLVLNRPDFSEKKTWDINQKESLVLFEYIRMAYKPIETAKQPANILSLLSINETFNVITIKLRRPEIDNKKLTKWGENLLTFLEAYGFTRVVPLFVGSTVEFKLFKGEKAYVTVGDVLLREDVQRFVFNRETFMPMILGIKLNDDLFKIDLKGNMAHVLVTGPTGGGKTWFLYNFITWLILFNKPTDVSFVFLDPKNEATFKQLMILPHAILYNGGYEGIPEILQQVCEEGERRLAKLSSAGCNNIETYRKKFPKDKNMPVIYIVVDELNALSAYYNEDKEIKKYILDRFDEITAKYRSAGIRMFGLSQYATSKSGGEVLSITTKRNMLLKCCMGGDQKDLEYLFGETVTNLRLKSGESAIKVGTDEPEYSKIPSIALSDDEAVDFIQDIANIWNKLKPELPKFEVLTIKKNSNINRSSANNFSNKNFNKNFSQSPYSVWDMPQTKNNPFIDDEQETANNTDDFNTNINDINEEIPFIINNATIKTSSVTPQNTGLTEQQQTVVENSNPIVELSQKLPIEEFIKRSGGRVDRQILEEKYTAQQIRVAMLSKRIRYDFSTTSYSLYDI